MKKSFALPLLIFVCGLLATPVLYAAPWAWTANFGQVQRLYPTGGKTYFRLVDGLTSMNPTNGYYYIPQSHSNYDAMIALLYKAAEVDWRLYVRTDESLDSNGRAKVRYLVVDF